MKQTWQATTQIFAPLHRRIGFFSLVVFTVFSLIIFQTVEKLHAETALESLQKMNYGLARYLVDHRMNPLINDKGEVDAKAMKDLASDVMMTNPALEVYLLDASGKIKAHAIDGFNPLVDAVNLRPINRLLSIDGSEKFPIYGDDPRHANRKNIFSVAAVDANKNNNQPTAYLYVILQGEAARSMDQATNRSNALYQALWLLGFSIVVALSLLWMSYSQLTRPLRVLAAQISSFKKNDASGVEGIVDSSDEVKSLAREFKSMQVRISQHLTEIETSNAAKRDLVSNISHDLFTPLACIQSYTERCLTISHSDYAVTSPQGELQNNLKVILRQSQRMDKRLKALFEFSRLDSDNVAPKTEIIALGELLHDVIQPYQLTAQASGVDLTVDIAASQNLAASQNSSNYQAPFLVAIDPLLIERVLQNLIDNALRYTPKNGAVCVALKGFEHHVLVSVSDTGSGIEPEKLHHIFDRFWQDQPSNVAHRAHSAGLGLAIVKKILALHKSQIIVSSIPSVATVFEFSLPRLISTKS